MTSTTTDDLGFLRAALTLARRGLGAVWPNPAVGCLLVRPDLDNRVVGRGWTQPGGRPHAEAEALRRAGDLAHGATAYVTLEPCDHHGQTPPCSEALIAAGIRRVVAAVEDPDPRVAGRGLARLRAAGVEVSVGLLGQEAAELNAGFFLRVREGRPLFTLKLATSRDGRIATHAGDSQWITGPEARAQAHLLRAGHDAVMVGIGTVLADDSRLTCRLPGLEGRHPVRIVADSHLRLPLTSHLVATARDVPTWLLTLPGNQEARLEVYRQAGVTVIEVPPDAAGRPDLVQAAREMGWRGLTRVLIEGGAHLAAGALRAGLVDRLAWFHAPLLIGGDGIPAVAAFGVDRLSQAPAFIRSGLRVLGADVLETGARR
ncbi:MAG: bifunctional diaminohydroxyphosphoribosylaminopyrimidine deaminase/5-amino-6-(5-phosphoribosylamino)uracil reductase RibD [Magnetospirillum sp. WYHS-4]